MTPMHLLGSPPIVHLRHLIPYALIPSCWPATNLKSPKIDI